MADVIDSPAQRGLVEDFAFVINRKWLSGLARGVSWKIREKIIGGLNRHGHMNEFSRANLSRLLSIHRNGKIEGPSAPGTPHLY